ncbi:MAG: methylmalonyl Co-A mutase-associated GTPase MeaB [Chitinophagaceae bacterium]|nr:MAG: methylmalonyl Co-A mutase-associated GTPase MeaB [Chitinophagaceae bacterium]
MNHPWHTYTTAVSKGDIRAIARSISLIENAVPGYEILLESISSTQKTPITGITGPPGAGKSTLVDALIGQMVNDGKRVAVLCVDPSSPFNLGALLGDRVRMSDWYNHPDVYIRSLATRGSLGGLHPAIIEITELLKTAPFDHIIVETVGVGQSEVEITGLSDTTVVVLVPESGDEIQTMKAGLMEIADVFVVNKGDRPEADNFIGNLKLMMGSSGRVWKKTVPVIKTIATEKAGIKELVDVIHQHQHTGQAPEKRAWLLTERAFHLLQQQQMKGFDKVIIKSKIEAALARNDFNLFRFVKSIS